MEPRLVRHTVPTHLQVQNRVIFGMTVGQLLAFMAAAVVSYWLYVDRPLWPLRLRITLAAICLVAGALLGLVRPLGQDVVSWAAIIARYARAPKRSVWRPPPDGGSNAVATARPKATAHGKRPPSVQAMHLLLETVERSPQGGGVLVLRQGPGGAGVFVYRSVLAVEGVPLADMALGEQQAVLAGYASFLNSLDLPLQLLVHSAAVDLEGHVSEVERRVTAPEIPAGLAAVAQDYASFVRRLATGRALLARRFYVILGASVADADVAGRQSRWRTVLTSLGLPRAMELALAPLFVLFAAGRDLVRLVRVHRPGHQRVVLEVEECRRRRAAADELDARCREVAARLTRCGLAARRLPVEEVAALCAASWAPERTARRSLAGAEFWSATGDVGDELVVAVAD